MKILIAISSKEYSGSTLGLGMKVATALKASTTIVDVGEKINEFGSKDVNIVNQLIEPWDFNRPGVEVLESYVLKLNTEDMISQLLGEAKKEA